MVRVGLVGVGFMGWIHWLAYKAMRGIEVEAICTRDPRKLAGDWRGIKGNFGPPGEQVDLSGIRTYSELDQLLRDDRIDVIDICLPPQLHVDAALRAFEAGKHVFCEKPLALTAEDCDRMCEAAERHGRQLLVGQVLPFFPEYAYLAAAVESKNYGRLLGGYFKRVISDPKWLPDFYDPQRIGGPMIDLHVHDAHFIRVLFGMPSAVAGQGRMHGDVVKHCTSLFYFDDPAVSVAATCGVIDQQGRGFTHGFEVHCELATFQYEFAVVGSDARSIMPLTIFHADGRVEEPELGAGDPVLAFHREVSEVRDAIESGKASPMLSGRLARDAIVLCHRQTESVRTRAIVNV